MTKVLFFPHSRRFAFFMGLLKEGVEKHGWEPSVVGTEGMRANVAALLKRPEDLYVQPNIDQLIKEVAPPTPRVRQLISECERCTGIPVNRILLANERTLGVGYARGAYVHPHRPGVRKLLSQPLAPQNVLAAVFERMERILDEAKPDIILAGNTAPMEAFVTMMLARQRNIPYVTGRLSKILSKRVYWTTDPMMHNNAAYTLCRTYVDKNHSPSDEALSHVSEFQKAPKTIDYIAKHWKRLQNNSFIKINLRLAELAVTHVLHKVRKRQGMRPKPFFATTADKYRYYYYSKRHFRLYTTLSHDELANIQYVYLPLHKEPELATSFQAPFWHDQINLIEKLSTALPMGCRLLVREHRGNHGRRWTTYLKEISALPNVTLIDPHDAQFKYIQHASLVVTDNGSSGWEALLLGRPALALAHSFYAATGLAHELRDPNKFAELVLNLLGSSEPQVSDDEARRRLGCLVDAEMQTTIFEGDAGYADSIATIERMAKP